MTKLRLNTHEIKRELRKNTELKSFDSISKYIGVSVGALIYWRESSVPDQLVMCYNIAQKSNHSLTELVNMLGNNYPIINLLKKYHEVSGKDIEALILKD